MGKGGLVSLRANVCTRLDQTQNLPEPIGASTQVGLRFSDGFNAHPNASESAFQAPAADPLA
jgi:hypothetical protein